MKETHTMKHTITTKINTLLTAHGAHTRDYMSARDTIVRTMRRVGAIAMQDGHRSGQAIDSRAIAAHNLPDARLFCRRDEGRDDEPPLGLVVLTDNSGSMCDLKPRALAIACGLLDGARRVGVPCLLAQHSTAGCGGGGVSLTAHRSTRGAMRHPNETNNMDAHAILHLTQHFRFPAKRTLVVLIADGLPCMGEEEHHEAATIARAAIAKCGGEMAYIFIAGDPEVGEARDNAAVLRARRDWGASRVADVSESGMECVAPVIASMLHRLRARVDRGA